jgi:hypothetical protein
MTELILKSIKQVKRLIVAVIGFAVLLSCAINWYRIMKKMPFYPAPQKTTGVNPWMKAYISKVNTSKSRL